MTLTLLDALLVAITASVTTVLVVTLVYRRLASHAATKAKKAGRGQVPRKSSSRLSRSEPEEYWRQTEALLNFYREVDGLPVLPPLRNWAINPDNLPILSRHIGMKRPRLLLECGCGSSTIALALLLRAHGVEGRILSFENHADSVARTEAHLARMGLDGYASIRHCELKPYRYPELDTEIKWYALPDLSGQQKADFLFVDGPPGHAGKLSRFPAGPELFPHLSPGASVFLDDALRPDEIEIVRLWCERFPGTETFEHDAEKGLVELVLPLALGA